MKLLCEAAMVWVGFYFGLVLSYLFIDSVLMYCADEAHWRCTYFAKLNVFEIFGLICDLNGSMRWKLQLESTIFQPFTCGVQYWIGHCESDLKIVVLTNACAQSWLEACINFAALNNRFLLAESNHVYFLKASERYVFIR